MSTAAARPGAGEARLRGAACLLLLAALAVALVWLEQFNREEAIAATFRSKPGEPPRSMVIGVRLPRGGHHGTRWRLVLGQEELAVNFRRNRVRAASAGNRELALPSEQGIYLVGGSAGGSGVLRPADLPLSPKLDEWLLWALEQHDPRRNPSPPPSFEEARRRLAAIVPAVDSFWGPPEPPGEPEDG